MLGLAEYNVSSTELLRLAQEREQEIADAINPAMTKKQAISVTEKIADQYYQDYTSLLDGSLYEISANAVQYYEQQTNSPLDKDEYNTLVKGLVDSQYGDSYYGATLARRLATNHRRMIRNITRSAAWGADFIGLKQLLTHPVPYGAQYNIDRRILLATAVKVEQDAARQMAAREDIELIRWSLSPRHPKEDICDDLATNVSKTVIRYIEENNLKLNPKGLYLLDELPPPPHPNCGCEYQLVSGKEQEEKGKVKRAASTVRNLLSRFRGK